MLLPAPRRRRRADPPARAAGVPRGRHAVFRGGADATARRPEPVGVGGDGHGLQVPRVAGRDQEGQLCGMKGLLVISLSPYCRLLSPVMWVKLVNIVLCMVIS